MVTSTLKVSALIGLFCFCVTSVTAKEWMILEKPGAAHLYGVGEDGGSTYQGGPFCFSWHQQGGRPHFVTIMMRDCKQVLIRIAWHAPSAQYIVQDAEMYRRDPSDFVIPKGGLTKVLRELGIMIDLTHIGCVIEKGPRQDCLPDDVRVRVKKIEKEGEPDLARFTFSQKGVGGAQASTLTLTAGWEGYQALVHSQ